MITMEIPSTGYPLLDSLISYGIFELILRVDPLANVHRPPLNTGKCLVVKSRVDDISAFRRLIEYELRKLSNSPDFQERLIDLVNVGGPRLPAHEVLIRYLKSMEAFNEGDILAPIKGRRGKANSTLYMIFIPVFGKGIRVYDSVYDPKRTVASPITNALSLIGLAFYSVKSRSREARIERILRYAIAFPPSVAVNGRVFLVVRRAIQLLEGNPDSRRVIERLAYVPNRLVPLILFSQLDLLSLRTFVDVDPTIVAIGIERSTRGGMESARPFNEYSALDVCRFLVELGEAAWEFKQLITGLTLTYLYGQISDALSVLLEIHSSIVNRDASLFSRALYGVQKIREMCQREENLLRMLKRYYFISRKSIVKVVCTMEKLSKLV